MIFQQVIRKFSRKIDSFIHLSEKEKGLNEIKDNIEDAYAKGKISEQHYNLLNKKRVFCEYK